MGTEGIADLDKQSLFFDVEEHGYFVNVTLLI